MADVPDDPTGPAEPPDAEDNVVQLRPVPRVIEGGKAATEPEREDGERGPPPAELLVPALEACLFVSAGVVTVAQLATALMVDARVVEGALEALGERLRRTGSGVRLVPVGDGWQLRTDARLATWVAAIRGGKPVRLSRAALETLAVVAFRQPVSKGVVDDLRGVDSGGVLRSLLDRGLLKVVGRSEEPGRPLTYGTTPAFLELFGMRSLADLPTLKDLRALAEDDAPDGGVVPFPEPEGE
jgi:segregation and condensation protein B